MNHLPRAHRASRNAPTSTLARHLRALLFLISVALVAPACSDDPAPAPTPAQQKNKRKQRTGQQRAESAINSSPLDASSWIPVEISAKNRLYLNGGRNPYRGFVDTIAEERERERIQREAAIAAQANMEQKLLPIQQYELGRLRLLAILNDLGNPLIQVRDPEGKLYILRENSLIGPPDTWISKIHEDHVIIKSHPPNPLSRTNDAGTTTDPVEDSQQCVIMRLHPSLDDMEEATQRRLEDRSTQDEVCEVIHFYPKEFDNTEIVVH